MPCIGPEKVMEASPAVTVDEEEQVPELEEKIESTEAGEKEPAAVNGESGGLESEPADSVVAAADAKPEADADADKPAAPKTPISLLQEIAVKKGLAPIYELLSTEGRVHEPTFVFRVAISGFVGTGAGKSKKTAKHVAARNCLEAMVLSKSPEWAIPEVPPDEALNYIHGLMSEMTNATPLSLGSGDNQVQIPSAAPPAPNPISQLHEMCMQRRWPAPVYDLKNAEGDPHDRMFTVVCKLARFERQGEGRSKKVAKRIAAEKMLEFLKEIPPAVEQENLSLDEEEAPESYAARISGYANIEKELTEIRRKELEESGNVSLSRKTKTITALPAGKGALWDLRNRNLDDESPDTQHVRLIRKISHEASYKDPIFTPLDRLSKYKELQCIVEVFSDPPTVSYGSHLTSPELAQYMAAKNALRLLQIKLLSNEE